MDSAPKGIELLGKYKTRKPVEIHYAKGGGEEQPYYEGWFTQNGNYPEYRVLEGSLSDWKWDNI